MVVKTTDKFITNRTLYYLNGEIVNKQTFDSSDENTEEFDEFNGVYAEKGTIFKPTSEGNFDEVEFEGENNGQMISLEKSWVTKLADDNDYGLNENKTKNFKGGKNSKKNILKRMFEAKGLKGLEKIWKLHESMEEPKETYADMIVYNPEGKVLLLQRRDDDDFEPNKWGFPGGKVNPGEKTNDGAVRECAEECMVICDGIKSKGQHINDDGSISHYYSGTTTDNPQIGDEHQNLTWVNPSEISNFDLIMGNNERYMSLLGLENLNEEPEDISESESIAPQELLKKLNLVSEYNEHLEDSKTYNEEPSSEKDFIEGYFEMLADDDRKLAKNMFKKIEKHDSQFADYLSGTYLE